MPVKMWCLINKKTRKPIQVGLSENTIHNEYAIGFATRKDLVEKTGGADKDERIVKIEFSDSQWARLAKPKKVKK